MAQRAPAVGGGLTRPAGAGMYWSMVLALLILSSLPTPGQGQGLDEPGEPFRPVNLTTQWGQLVNRTSVAAIPYPRPQLQRPASGPVAGSDWVSLNGPWQWGPWDPKMPIPFGADLASSILVPYPPEALLSGIFRNGISHMLYRRLFTVPAGMTSASTLLLHFGAVDWESTVYIDGILVGTHRGGYTSFELDITPQLSNRTGQHELLLAVFDPTEYGTSNLIGKQRSNVSQSLEGGILYLASSGAWQDIWLEAAPAARITSLSASASLQPLALNVRISCSASGQGSYVLVQVIDMADTTRVLASGYGLCGSSADVKLPSGIQLWAPDTPVLYDLVAKLTPLTSRDPSLLGPPASGGTAGPFITPPPSAIIAQLQVAPPLDLVRGYTGVRTVSRCFDGTAILRMCLNGAPIIPFGPLDQGLWPEGLYSAPTAAALLADLQLTKELGFNMVRKHAKVEPSLWFYYADTLGLMVLQDVPSPPGSYYQLAGNTSTGYQVAWNSSEAFDHPVTAAMQASYLGELNDIVEQLRPFPSLVTYILFNEGWGQPVNTPSIAAYARGLDATRLHMGSTGWASGAGQSAGSDFLDRHDYTPAGPTAFTAAETQGLYVSSVGEMGGISLYIPGHVQFPAFYGPSRVAKVTTSQQWSEVFDAQVASMVQQARDPAIGLSLAVFTETSDVQYDITGLVTYDRRVVKVNVSAVADTVASFIECID